MRELQAQCLQSFYFHHSNIIFAQLIDYSGIFAKSYCSTSHKIEPSQLISWQALAFKLLGLRAVIVTILG